MKLNITLPAVLALALAACGGDAPAPAPAVDTTANATSSTSALAPADTHGGEDHEHGSPHGGTVKTAGRGHLELVLDGDRLVVYSLGANEETLPVAGTTGATALVQRADGSTETISLTPEGEALVGQMSTRADRFTAIVSVPVAGETRSARFEVGADGHSDHAH